jgi:hypothetical protein
MKTQIPAPRVPLIDGASGMMSREWFSYFANTFERLGGGNSDVTVPELVDDIATREDASNKVTSWTATPTDVHYPSEKLVKDELDDKEDVANKVITWTAPTSDTNYPSEKLVKGVLDGKEDVSNKVTSWTATTTDAHYPSEKLVKDAINGKQDFHGVESIGTVTFNNTSHILTLSTIKYWYFGVSFTGTAVTCDIDSFETLTNNTLYYFFFDASAGTLKCNKSGLNLKTQVPIAIVMWNGSSGAVMAEWHSHTRDIDWHINAHLTIGARYYSGLSLTTPTTSVDNALSISGGSIYDEDLLITISNPQTSMRGWYKVSSSVYTFSDYALPYVGTSGKPQYLDTDTYTLTNVGSSDFVCMWVYASNDITVPLYVIPTHAGLAHNTVAIARTEGIPSLAGLNISPEMKLLYKFIYKGDGQFQEMVDYRMSSSLPAGGTPATSASSVTFSPTGSISASDVQAALTELDTEKQATLISASNIKTINSNSLLGSGDIVITGSGEMNVQADWNQADNAQDDYIKNKPASLPASDVSAWAKAATKPTYTASEVGTLTTQQIQSLVSIRF